MGAPDPREARLTLLYRATVTVLLIVIGFQMHDVVSGLIELRGRQQTGSASSEDVPRNTSGGAVRSLLTAPPSVLYTAIATLDANPRLVLSPEQRAGMISRIEREQNEEKVFQIFRNAVTRNLSAAQLAQVQKNVHGELPPDLITVNINPSQVPTDPIWPLAFEDIAKIAHVSPSDVDPSARPLGEAVENFDSSYKPADYARGLLLLAHDPHGGLTTAQLKSFLPYLKAAAGVDAHSKVRDDLLAILTDEQRRSLTADSGGGHPSVDAPAQPEATGRSAADLQELLYCLSSGVKGKPPQAAGGNARGDLPPPVGPPQGPAIEPPHGPAIEPPHGPAIGPPHGPAIGPPHGPPIGPPHGPPIGPPRGPAVGPPQGPPMGPPLGRPPSAPAAPPLEHPAGT